MPDRRFSVQWQVARDERFRHVVRGGVATADRRAAHSVHVEAGGLRPGAEYFYRFRVPGHVSPTGRTLTTPARGSMPDGTKIDCAERLDPARTITGVEQEDWLTDGLRRSRARWDVLGQQVFFAQRDLSAGPPQGFSMDAWDGYRAERDRLAAALGQVRNGVVLTGDVHRHWAGEIKENADRPDSRGVGVELVATSITSGGDGNEDTNAAVLAENPHLKFFKNRRGYVRTRFTTGELRTDFRVVPYVRTPDAPASTAASFVTEDRNPALQPA